MGDTRHQGVDIAVVVFQALDVAFDPVLGQPFAALREMLEELAEQLRVLLGHRLAKIRDLTDFPQQLDALRRPQAWQEVRPRRQGLQGELIVLFAHTLQGGMRRCPIERRDQCRHRNESELAVAPLHIAQRIEAMVLDCLDDFGLERTDVGRGAERAVVHVPSGATGDLCQLDVAQGARRAAVIFTQ